MSIQAMHTHGYSSTVVVLEWVCGGGLLHTPLKDIPAGLRLEGQAMLQALVEGLVAGGIDVRVPIDVRLFDPPVLKRIASKVEIVAIQPADSPDYGQVWCQLATSSQWTWLVAPELHGVLQRDAWRLRQAGARLLNASDDFVACTSDKLQTASALQRAGIAHPPTRSLHTVDATWLNATSGSHLPSATVSTTQQWVVKRIDGAGGEGLQIVGQPQLLRLLDQFSESTFAANLSHITPHMIVQPWIPGIAASCSAIVDASGRAHWLPLVSQDFEVSSMRSPGRSKVASHQAAIRYLGYTSPVPGIAQEAPTELLDQVLKAMPGDALGWIGIDLLYDPLKNEWWVIEVNPRFTSSLVGLALSYSGKLVFEAFRLQTGLQTELISLFAPSTFRVDRCE